MKIQSRFGNIRGVLTFVEVFIKFWVISYFFKDMYQAMYLKGKKKSLEDKI